MLNSGVPSLVKRRRNPLEVPTEAKMALLVAATHVELVVDAAGAVADLHAAVRLHAVVVAPDGVAIAIPMVMLHRLIPMVVMLHLLHGAQRLPQTGTMSPGPTTRPIRPRHPRRTLELGAQTLRPSQTPHHL
jgi:hypothetical protein